MIYRKKDNYDSKSPLAQAKASVTIHEVWEELELRGSPDKNPCRSPFRQDSEPSFSVSEDGKLFNDFATKDGGGIIEFLMLALKCDTKQACRWLLEYAETLSAPWEAPEHEGVVKPPKPLARLECLPTLHVGTTDELEQLSKLRGISTEALRLASDAGLLWFTELEGRPAWLATDQARYNAQARCLDGGLWSTDSKVKGFTGNNAQWPIGIIEAQRRPIILLVEGSPDLLAAFHFILKERRRDVAPVCMTGATALIHQEALEYFRGKHIRIMAHADKAGVTAAKNWKIQLVRNCSKVDSVYFDNLILPNGQSGKDLNDAVLAGHTEKILPTTEKGTK